MREAAEKDANPNPGSQWYSAFPEAVEKGTCAAEEERKPPENQY